MKETTRNLFVGLFVLASMAVLCLLMVWFGETPSWLGGSEWTLRITDVEDLGGVDEGSPVRLNGVQIGRVKTLEFENAERPDLGVVIVTRINREYSVPQGARAKVYGALLGVGMGSIQIVVPRGERLEPLDREFAAIRGEMHSVIGEIINQQTIGTVERTIDHIGNLAAAATPVADNLALMLEKRSVEDLERPDAPALGIGPNIPTVIERLDRFVANLNAILGDENVQGDVKQAVWNLKEGAVGLRQTVGLWGTESQKVANNVNSAIDGTKENLDQSFASLMRILDDLDGASNSFAMIMQRVEAGEGTAGMLVRDARLYEAAVLTFERFNEVLATIQRIASKIEKDGHFTVGKDTPVGVLTKDFPVGNK